MREIKGPAGGSRARANDAGAGPWQLYDMESDPGETIDLAAQHPEIVADLSARYDAWFADASRPQRRRLPLPVGHPQHDPVALHAPQAFVDPPLHFAAGPGFANDWLTGWTDPEARIRYEIDVAAAGDYDVEIAYARPAADAGSTVRLSAGDRAVESVVPPAEPVELPLPHRDAEGATKYRNRAWATLRLGTLALPAGPATLVLQPVTMPGSQVLEFAGMTLSRRP